MEFELEKLKKVAVFFKINCKLLIFFLGVLRFLEGAFFLVIFGEGRGLSPDLFFMFLGKWDLIFWR